MTTFPNPHNPENLPPAAPSYRYIGEDEAKKPGDEYIDGPEWRPSRDAGKVANWTYRRALNVDDPHAPPPSEWDKPGYTMGLKGLDLLQIFKAEWWDKDKREWRKVVGYGPSPYYYRHLSSMTTSSQSIPASCSDKPVLKPGQSIVVNTHDHLSLYRAVQHIAFDAGWEWVNTGKGETEVTAGWSTVELKSDKKMFNRTNRVQIPGSLNLDARTDLGLLIDLLAKPPAPIAPTIHGYKGEYIKGQQGVGLDDIVKFGCAELSLSMMRRTHDLMTLERVGNRTISAITLSSGVALKLDDIKAILDYVNAVNKA